MVKVGRGWNKLFTKKTLAGLIGGVILLSLAVGLKASGLFAQVAEVWAPALVWSDKITHQQEVWLHALEWCESRGLKTAINPKDLDGTPSYYSFQFKPSTFKQFGIKYGLFSKKISDAEVKAKLDDYALQKKIVATMINDARVIWTREFPVCVRKLGRPPLAS